MLAVILGMLLQNWMVGGVSGTLSGERLTIVGGYPFVDVAINGAGPFRMMIDTGATSCALTPEAVRAARLVTSHRVLLTTMAGERPVPASYARVRVGPVEAVGVEVLTSELNGLRPIPARVDGVLGQSFLGQFAYLIDYRQRLLWVGDEAVRQSPRLKTEIVAERIYGRMVLPVEIESGDGRWRLTLDTGANGLIMHCGTHCPELRESRDDGRILTNYGSCPVRRGTLHRITVGTLKIPWAEVALVDGVTGLEDGVLPASWFSAVYVDSARNVVRLTK